jgi:hypothetical protein
MKRIICIAVFLFSTLVLCAQKDSVFYRHELRASVGPALASELWFQDGGYYGNFSAAYFYRPIKDDGFWAGINFINYFGDKIYYYYREYGTDKSFHDFSKSKIKYGFAIAPEIRFSRINKTKSAILYWALSGGFGWEYGYDKRWDKYPMRFPYFHLTYFGFGFNLGQNKNIFLGGEFGVGFKGLFNMHGGYRF